MTPNDRESSRFGHGRWSDGVPRPSQSSPTRVVARAENMAWVRGVA